jgi:hypothetical protein
MRGGTESEDRMSGIDEKAFEASIRAALEAVAHKIAPVVTPDVTEQKAASLPAESWRMKCEEVANDIRDAIVKGLSDSQVKPAPCKESLHTAPALPAGLAALFERHPRPWFNSYRPRMDGDGRVLDNTGAEVCAGLMPLLILDEINAAAAAAPEPPFKAGEYWLRKAGVNDIIRWVNSDRHWAAWRAGRCASLVLEAMRPKDEEFK